MMHKTKPTRKEIEVRKKTLETKAVDTQRRYGK